MSRLGPVRVLGITSRFDLVRVDFDPPRGGGPARARGGRGAHVRGGLTSTQEMA